MLPLPPISPLNGPIPVYQSIISSSLLTLSYVGGLYFSTKTRIGHSQAQKDQDGLELTKNSPQVIKARLKTVSLVTGVGCIGTMAWLAWKGVVKGQPPIFSSISLLTYLGIPLPQPSFLNSSTLPFNPSITTYLFKHLLPSILYPLTLTASLYLGPIYVSFLEKELPGQKEFDFKRDVEGKYKTLNGVRNYLVGPITEELVFRSCMISTAFFSGLNKTKTIFTTPLYFGLAHLHHAWEVYVEGGRTNESLKKGALQSALQFAYTSLFGWYSSFLFMRTGNVLAPLSAHIFCNIMGLPNPFRAVEWHPKQKYSIYLSHILGIVSFTYLLYPLTNPNQFGGSVYWLPIQRY